MRKELCTSLLQITADPNSVFLTGDLGYAALEPLQELMGERFINVGVAEQNMISVAAALAKDGWQPWVYSIAPFVFARPFEQIRNDVCLHDLPVRLLGNGGGYGYGVMGPTHHAIEDYGVLLSLPFMKVFVPCFDEDVDAVLRAAAQWQHPCYIRLGRGEPPKDTVIPTYQPWRRVLAGDGAVVICAGPLGGVAWSVCLDLPKTTCPDLWIVSELPITDNGFPEDILVRIQNGAPVLVIEEHIAQGSLGSMLAHFFMTRSLGVRNFKHLSAKGLAMGTYGSQNYLRAESGLSPNQIKDAIVASIEDLS